MVKSKGRTTADDKKPLTARQEKLAEKKKAELAKSKLMNALGFSFVLSIFLAIPLALFKEPKVGLVTSFAISAAIISYLYPRSALWAFLIYVPFGGTITYWLGEGNLVFQLAKDIFYIPALIALIVECRKNGLPIIIPKQLGISLSIILFFAIATLLLVNAYTQFFIPECSSLSQAESLVRDASGQLVLDSNQKVISVPCKKDLPLLQGIYGFKILLGYVPLIFCTYYLIEDKKTLFFFGRLLIVLCIICCLLGLAQYWMLKTGRCASNSELGASGSGLFRASLKGKCLVGGSLLYSPEQNSIRLPGTFVSPWHWAWFLSANAGISFAVAFCDSSLFWRFGGLISLGLVFINAIICGQRQAIAFVPMLVLILLVTTGQLSNFKRSIGTIIGLGAVVFIGLSLLNPSFVQQRIDSFVTRWDQAPPQDFIVKQFEFSINQQRNILGRGLGTATNSARSFGSVAFVETYYPKLLYEIGPFGLAAFIIFTTHLTYLSFKNAWSIRDKVTRNFTSCFAVFIPVMGYFTFWYPLDTDPVNVYYWMFAGIVFRANTIDQEERHINKKPVEPTTKRKSWKNKTVSP